MVLWNQEFFFMEAIVKYQNRVFFKMAFTKILDTVFIAQILKSRQRDGLCQKKGMPVVNQYIYLPDASLNVLIFEEMTEEWLDFIADCRRGIEHSYDIVEGPMADDQIWNYVEDFVTGKSSRAAFGELAKFSYPTHQIVFCTQRSLKNLKFEGSVRYYAK